MDSNILTKCRKCGETYGRHRSAMCRDDTLHTWGNVVDLQSQLTAAQERIEKLEAALREYADVDNWVGVNIQGREMPSKDLFVPSDNGYEIAQTALREEAE